MPSIFEPITKLAQRWFPPPKPVPTTSGETASKTKQWSYQSSTLQWLQVERGRMSTVNDCRFMYDTDGRHKSVVSTLARDIVGKGFRVLVDPDYTSFDTANQIASALPINQQLKILSRLDDWIRLALRDGDLFLELGLNAAKEIADISAKPALFMRRNSNTFDRFDDPSQAFGYSENGLYISQAEVTFAEWQIVHARANFDEGNRYGSPAFASARKAWKMLTDGEQNLAINRKHFANKTDIHILEGADDTAIAEYQEANKDALGNPFAPAINFFTNKVGGIQRLTGGANLGDIKDILHHLSTWSADSPVPIELLGYGDNVNALSGDVLKHKKEQYQSTIEAYRAWAAEDILKPIIETQWLLAGLYPPNIKYEIVWLPGGRVKSADIEESARALAALKAVGLLPDELLIDMLTAILPMIDREKALEYLAQKADTGVAQL